MTSWPSSLPEVRELQGGERSRGDDLGRRRPRQRGGAWRWREMGGAPLPVAGGGPGDGGALDEEGRSAGQRRSSRSGRRRLSFTRPSDEGFLPDLTRHGSVTRGKGGAAPVSWASKCAGGSPGENLVRGFLARGKAKDSPRIPYSRETK